MFEINILYEFFNKNIDYQLFVFILILVSCGYNFITQTIRPSFFMKSKFLALAILAIYLFSFNFCFGQCASNTNIYSFFYNGKTYEVVKENQTWVNASSCAVLRGGKLLEVNSLAEQNAIYNQVLNNAGVVSSNTTAPDGGGGAYVWLGGNDLATEGSWIWDGDNDGNGAQFWMGTNTGMPIGGLYNNFSVNEPDNFGTNGQDGLGLAITNWPLGVSGQWNDVNENNTLYYVIEYPTIMFKTDLSIVVTTIPSVLVGPTSVGVVVDLHELNGRNSDGSTITVQIVKDARFTFAFDPTLTTVGFSTVNNTNWTYNSGTIFHEFTTNSVIQGKQSLSFGYIGTYDPQGTTGQTSITATLTVNSGGDTTTSNNSDSEKIAYFD